MKMSEIPFEWLVADALIIAMGLFTAIDWCPFLIYLTKWREDPITIQKVVVLGGGLFVPLLICWGIIQLFIL